jgi:exodeoxyribonuclease V alpha subunit
VSPATTPSAFDSIDLQLGALMDRRARPKHGAESAELLALTAALLSAERGRGHSCLHLDDDVTRLCDDAREAGYPCASIPTPDEWRVALAASPLCGDGSQPTPLVLEGERVYLYRFWAAERRLAASFRRLLAAAPDEAGPGATALFHELFTCAADEVDWQAVAAAGALRHRLTVITGGPGTGKTTTVARVLALLLADRPGLRIALAAPTGKAAARLSESVAAAAASFSSGSAIAQRVGAAGRTLHRLLGYQPWDDRFRHGPANPLAEDVVVVDEASMVDLLMMDALFAALRPGARIILLGDHDQLSSVDTGYVLGDLCAAAGGCGESFSPGFAAAYHALSGQIVPSERGAPPVRDAVVRLRRSWRFEKQPGIGALAAAVRAGDGKGAAAVLADASLGDVRRADHGADATALLAPVLPAITSYMESASPDVALARLNAFRVLCAMREGAWGATGLNQAVEWWLRRQGHAVREAWYHLRPVLVTANDHSVGLYNGDVGVCFRIGGSALVYFADGEGAVRAVAPSRLPACQTAWAMTVHKSQGSEFGQVLLVLPDGPSRVVGRELLYTGITRARERVDVVGSVDAIVGAASRVTVRRTGLGRRIVEET